MNYSKHTQTNEQKGFTLIELLVVVSIIAILSVFVILTLNPAEMLKQARDSNRVSDLSTLKTAISLYLADIGSPNLASSSFGYSACYLSTASGNGTTTAKCGTFTGAGITVVASTSVAAYKNVDSTGWMPVNFKQLSIGSAFAALPVDPTNDRIYYYSYAATSNFTFEIDAFMESTKYKAGGSSDIVTKDGGNNNLAYEVGSSLGL
jgi:prepilin-type N-terminal cleavage/methylation domain-containing protein